MFIRQQISFWHLPPWHTSPWHIYRNETIEENTLWTQLTATSNTDLERVGNAIVSEGRRITARYSSDRKCWYNMGRRRSASESYHRDQTRRKLRRFLVVIGLTENFTREILEAFDYSICIILHVLGGWAQAKITLNISGLKLLYYFILRLLSNFRTLFSFLYRRAMWRTACRRTRRN